ncbi:MAG: MaoC/PaaZ C-terminal domain-containing protein [Vicinamibacterales bacterium]
MLPVGTLLKAERTLSQRDFDRFAELSGDRNPIHVDPVHAAKTRFGKTVSHGVLLYGLLWALVTRRLPGARACRQTLLFPAPAFADEPLDIEIKVLESDAVSCRLACRIARRNDGAVVCEGQTSLTSGGNPMPENPHRDR